MGKTKSNNKINVFFVFSAFELPILAHLSIVFAYTQIFMLILSEMLKIALNYAKKLTNFISHSNMKIYTPIEYPYQI